MSESAAIIKMFFDAWLRKSTSVDTLRAAGAEDKPLLGSKLSADSGAKTRLGPGVELSPSANLFHWDGINAINPRGLGTESPDKRSSFYPQLSSSVPLSRRGRSFVGSMSPPSTSA